LQARHVEVQLLRLHRVERDQVVNDPDFLPLSLNWSHISRTVMSAIPPGLFRQIDLCHTYDLGVAPAKNWIEFDTEIRPNQIRPDVWPTRKGPGEYRLDFVASADNAKPAYRTLSITFTGTWTADERKMFSEHLHVQVQGQKPRK
jgi:hypothetical protein